MIFKTIGLEDVTKKKVEICRERPEEIQNRVLRCSVFVVKPKFHTK